ncbi:MAG: tetratricopeptide repeat protein [Bryobacteraceae bacterium]|nr:tetratricopeptide repeat protein [Bryobacteraceae bacterium]MDW8376609.1 tetratricopeptide repeat protein [Bryobacterales bacterium]
MAAERKTDGRDSHFEEALARTREGNAEEALRIYRRMAVSAGDPARKALGLLGQGWVYFDLLCQDKTARDLARQAMTVLQPVAQTPEVLWLLGYAHALAANCEAASNGNAEAEANRALRFLEQALRVEPSPEVERDATASAALVYMLLSRPKDAAKYWIRYLELEHEPRYEMQGRIRLAGCYRSAGDPASAMAVLQKALNSSVDDAGLRAQALCEMGALQTAAGNFLAAKTSFERALEVLAGRPGLPSEQEIAAEARLNLVDVLHRLGETSAAEAQFQQALESLLPIRSAYRVNALMWLGAVEMNAGQEEHAQRCFTAITTALDASEQQRHQARQRLALLEAYQLQDAGEHAEARAALLTLLAQCSESDEVRLPALLALAECHIELESYAAVQEVCETILRCSPLSDSERAQALEKLRYSKGMRLFSQRKYAQALLHFNEVLEDKTTIEIYRWNSVLMAGKCCYFLRDFRTARKRYDEILKAPGLPRDFHQTAATWKARIPKPWWAALWPF